MRCGGGTNYRYGLFDEIVIKDNHIAAAGGIANALGAVPVQSEVEGFVELVEGVAHGASQIMLDNFAVNDMRVAVERVRAWTRCRQPDEDEELAPEARQCGAHDYGH